MTNIVFTSVFKKKAAKLKSENPKLSKVFKMQFKRFRQNPRHKGLRLHKLKGERSQQYAVWIEGDLRALAMRDEDIYVFFDIVNHDSY
jgi:hypothetical protein